MHPTKYIFNVNSAKYKIFKNHKKYLEVLQFLKPKDQILIDIQPFIFCSIYYEYSRFPESYSHPNENHPLLSWKTLTLKSSRFGKRPYAWNRVRTTFSGPIVCPKYSELEAKDPRLWYWTIYTQSIKCMGLKSLFFRNYFRTYTLW